MKTAHDVEEVRKAKAYVSKCEKAVDSAMHCTDATFKQATLSLRRAQIRLQKLST